MTGICLSAPTASVSTDGPEQIAVALVRGTAEKRPCAPVQQTVAFNLLLHLGHHTGIGALRVDLKNLIILQVR